MDKIRIVWNGQGGELDSVTVEVKDENAVSDALISLVQGNVITAGDSFVVEAVV